MPRVEFPGNRALVTGGSRGIGRRIAARLAGEGVEVHVFDLAPGHGDEAVFHRVDICDPVDVAEAVRRLPADLNLVVNNAGITRDRSLAKMSDEEWRAVLDTNLGGAFYVIRALTPRLAACGAGRIVNIASINALRGKFGQANYTAAKAGLIGLTKTAARELGPKGINVNAVAPGMVLTDMAADLPAAILDKALAESVLGRLATPDDVASAVLFLLSQNAAAITGQVIKVDAGQLI